MRALQTDLLAFHQLLGLETHFIPTKASLETIKLRQELIREETKETIDALDKLIKAESDVEINEALAEVADGIIDSCYVLIGAAVSLGIRLAPIWHLVQEANMAKAGGPIREDGKRLKPEGWKPPDVLGEIIKQMKE